MAQARYTVKPGDTLWDIAGQVLGSSEEWPRLYTYNNRPEVVRQTGRPIINPDLIFPNQILLLPAVQQTQGQRPAPNRPTPNGPVRPSPVRPPNAQDRLHDVQVPFAVSYKLDDLPIFISKEPGFTATIKMTGKVIIELGQKVPINYVVNRGQELSYKQQTDTALEQLLSETKVTWNRSTNVLSFENMMVTNSTTPSGPTTAIGISIASDKPFPSLKAEIKFPELKGRINGHSYLALDIAVEIELTPDQPPANPPTPVVHPAPAPTRNTVDEITLWTFALGATLLVGTLVADFLTAGASVADDPITVPAALALMGFGVVVHELPGVEPIEPR